MQPAAGGREGGHAGSSGPDVSNYLNQAFSSFPSLHIGPPTTSAYHHYPNTQQPPPFYSALPDTYAPVGYSTFTNSAFVTAPPPLLQQPYVHSNHSTVSNGTTYYYGAPPPTNTPVLQDNSTVYLNDAAYPPQCKAESNTKDISRDPAPTNTEPPISTTGHLTTNTGPPNTTTGHIIINSGPPNATTGHLSPNNENGNASISSPLVVSSQQFNSKCSGSDSNIDNEPSTSQSYRGNKRLDTVDQGRENRSYPKSSQHTPEHHSHNYPKPVQAVSEHNYNSSYSRGRRDNYQNSRGRGRGGGNSGNFYYDESSQCDDRNKGRSEVLADAAAFAYNSNNTRQTGNTRSPAEYGVRRPNLDDADPRSYRRGGGRGGNTRNTEPLDGTGSQRRPVEYAASNTYQDEAGGGYAQGGRYGEPRGRGKRGGRGAGGGKMGDYNRATEYACDQRNNSRQNMNNYKQSSYRNSNDNGSYTNGSQRNFTRNNSKFTGDVDPYREASNSIQTSPTGDGDNSSNDEESNDMSEGSNNSRGKALKNFSNGRGYSHESFSMGRGYSYESFSNDRGKGYEGSSNSRGRGPRMKKSVITSSGYNEEDSKNQRDELIEQLQRGTYECMVCCERIRQQQPIWSCRMCYNCFHLGCIKKWANSSKEVGESGWRCPACNNQSSKRPNSYLCFCGKLRDPEYNRRDLPHTCGEMCGRSRDNGWCTHKCNVLCHPGPCPPCMGYIKRWCGCGAVDKDIRCSNGGEPLLCGGVCGKALACGSHNCGKLCHQGDCEECVATVEQVCHCGKGTRGVPCSVDTRDVTTYECGDPCGRSLDCGQHMCEQLCHEGACQPCLLTVGRVTHCPCGHRTLESIYQESIQSTTGKPDGQFTSGGATKKDKAGGSDKCKGTIGATKKAKVPADEGKPSAVEVSETQPVQRRQTCADPIPTCGKVCNKRLLCGKPGAFHTCKAVCHVGSCPPCPQKTPVRCRCGSMDQNIECRALTSKADEVTCERQCKKLRFCGRHRCGTKCCIDVDHVCPLKCGKFLSCGKHRCGDDCHRGNCSRCWEVSWEELTCHCGAAIMLPPIPCGSKAPLCSLTCSRPASCGHPATHCCHPDEKCPPCTVLMEARCFGGHKVMRSIACHLQSMSCGDLCAKPLACGHHACDRVCHKGECVVAGARQCPQKCTKARQGCGHPCNNACHDEACPNNNCREKVTVSCKCGHRSTTMQCSDNDREYRAMATAKLATQLQHVGHSGASVDLSHILGGGSKERFRRLECSDACLSRERVTRLAIALQIENPESRGSLGTAAGASVFSDFLKEEARKDAQFAKMVHEALTSLVVKARDSKQRSRSHSFTPMSRDKRQFIHEYCKAFGCSSIAYDEEPKKNVVVTAQRGMCLLPVSSIVTVVQRGSGQKKVPGPVWGPRRPPTAATTTTVSSGSITPSGGGSNGGLRKLERVGSLEKEEPVAATAAAKPPPIDYFDFAD